MKIEQLRRVIEVANTGSINRAAQNLFVAQSSLSSSIRALEQELGREIFIRTQSGIALSPFGAVLVDHAREILEHVEAIEMSGESGQEDKSPQQLDVVVYYLLFASHAFTQLCNKYKNERFGFNYMERSRTEIVAFVASGRAEIGFLMMPGVDREKWLALFNAQGIEYTRLTVEQPCAIVGSHSDLYTTRDTLLTPKRLANHKMIVFPEENELFRSIDRKVFKPFMPSGYLNVDDRGTLISILGQTSGYYLATRNKKAYSRVTYYANTRILPVTGVDFCFELGYVTLRGHALSPIAQEYLQMITDLLT